MIITCPVDGNPCYCNRTSRGCNDSHRRALPPGQGRDRVRLYDNQWRNIWDSATDTTPAYKHIADWCHATIDYVDRSRWVGKFYRTPLGIQQEPYPDPNLLKHMLKWPTFEELRIRR